MLSLRPKLHVIPRMLRDREGRERLAYVCVAEFYGKVRMKVVFADEINHQALLSAPATAEDTLTVASGTTTVYLLPGLVSLSIPPEVRIFFAERIASVRDQLAHFMHCMPRAPGLAHSF